MNEPPPGFGKEVEMSDQVKAWGKRFESSAAHSCTVHSHVVRCQITTLRGEQCKRQAHYRERGKPWAICGVHASGRDVVPLAHNA